MITAAPHALCLSLGLLGGPLLLDGGLADYRWSVTPRSSWGVEAMAERGWWGSGVRVTRTGTTQTIGVPDPSSAASVDLSTLEWVGQGRFASVAGFDCYAAASAGWLHLSYRPDRVEVPTSGTPITVDLAPIDTWIAGGGLGLRRGLGGPWSASVEMERRFFAMDTAHRSGSTVVFRREHFGDWNARVALAWSWTRMKGTS